MGFGDLRGCTTGDECDFLYSSPSDAETVDSDCTLVTSEGGDDWLVQEWDSGTEDGGAGAGAGAHDMAAG